MMIDDDDDDDDDDWYHGKTPKWCPFLLEKIHRFRTGKNVQCHPSASLLCI